MRKLPTPWIMQGIAFFYNSFQLKSVNYIFNCTWRTIKCKGKIIHEFIYTYFCFLHFGYWISCGSHADQIWPKLSISHESMNSPAVREDQIDGTTRSKLLPYNSQGTMSSIVNEPCISQHIVFLHFLSSMEYGRKQNFRNFVWNSDPVVRWLIVTPREAN